MNNIEVGGRKIGDGAPAYIVAEMSANHNQDFAQAVQIIQAAKESGADAIKIQTYTPDTLTIDCDNEYFRIGSGTIWEGRKLYDLYRDAHTPWDWQPKLKRIAEDLGLDFFSTPFDETSVDFLESLNVPAYKVSSFEVADLALIERIARTGKPIIVSTGMAAIEEIAEALRTVRSTSSSQVALLKCTSAYPSPPEEMHLRTIPHLKEAFNVPVGISDHTLGIAVPVAAVALGACIVEKHFALSRSVKGPDSAFSLEPEEFKSMAIAIRTAQAALGTVNYAAGQQEEKSRIFRRSLFIVNDMRPGDPFTTANLRSIRPGYGLSPRHLRDILGKRAACELPRGTPLAWKHVVC